METCRHCARTIVREPFGSGERWVHEETGYWYCQTTTAGPANPDSTPPECENHVERQHRDMQPPWCSKCGWTHGKPAVAAAKLGTSRAERLAAAGFPVEPKPRTDL